jgi:hypothetical protein
MKLKIFLLLVFILGTMTTALAQAPASLGSRVGPNGLEFMDYAEKAFGAADPIVIITKQVVVDFQCIPNPGNPPAGNVRLYCDSGTGQLTCLTSTGGSCISGGGGGSGTVTNFTSGNLSPIFTTSVATPTVTPALTFSLTNAAQNSVFAGPPSGGAGAPSYQTAPTFSAINLTNIPASPGSGTQNALTFWNTTSSLGSIFSNITGQIPVAANSAAPAFASPGVVDSTASPTSAPYTIQCDSSSALIDRVHVIRLQSGTTTVTVPASTTSGCAGGFTTTLLNDGAGSVTVSASGSDTFSVFNGITNTDSATSFTLTNGQYATLTQGASGIWEIRITAASGTVYKTASSATLTNIAATSMVATTSAQHDYTFNWTASLTAVGVACTGTTTVILNAIFTDPNHAGATTQPLATITLANTGVGTLGFLASGVENILAASGTAVQYSTTSYTAGAGCSTNPTYIIYPTLTQNW